MDKTVDEDARRVAGLVARRIEEAMLDGDAGLKATAAGGG
jgi:hypothetical protein